MLLVKTRIATSSIHGMGLFASEPIPRGTPFWRFEPGFDQIISPERLLKLPLLAQQHIRWFAYVSQTDAHYILSGDFCCFMNHSVNPNTGAPSSGQLPVTTIALRDIVLGEELTCDYYAFDAEARQKLILK
ncbi:MAG TPA: SET domain-containing protein [Verrucomicrobiae bacterium]